MSTDNGERVEEAWDVVTVSLAMYEVSSGVAQAFPALEMSTVIQMRACRYRTAQFDSFSLSSPSPDLDAIAILARESLKTHLKIRY